MLKIDNLSGYFKDTIILTGGVIFAQAVPVLVYPILARLYSPASFGVLSTLTSIVGILSIVATLKYETSILITKSKRLAAEFTIAIQFVALLIIAVFSLFLVLFPNLLPSLLNAPQIKNWLWVCPISAYGLVLFNSFNEWCVRNAYFKSLAINKMINGGTIQVGKLVFSFGAFNSFGLIIGDLLGHVVTGVSCVWRALKMDKESFMHPSILHMKYLLRRYVDCPKYVLPGQLLNKFGWELPVFFTMAFFSAEELGYYSMAMAILVLPASVISRSVRDTFRKKANDIYLKTGNCARFYKKIFLYMSGLSILFFSVLWIIAPQLFSIILGEEWIKSGYYSQLLTPMVAINFITDVGTGMYYIREKMNVLFFRQVMYFLFTLAAMCLGGYVFKSIVATLLCLTIGRSLVFILDGFLTYRLAKGL